MVGPWRVLSAEPRGSGYVYTLSRLKTTQARFGWRDSGREIETDATKAEALASLCDQSWRTASETRDEDRQRELASKALRRVEVTAQCRLARET